MTSARRFLAHLAAAAVLAALPRAAFADACPDARDLRRAGDFAGAERAARACMDLDPDDVGTWFELSRVVGYQGRYAEALHWVQRGLERYPDDADLAVWRVRLLAWMGRLREARLAFEAALATTPDILKDRETAMLEVDLRFWSEEWALAGEGFTSYLEAYPDDPEALRKRGITWLRRGDEAHAVMDFEASCSLGGGEIASCRYVDVLKRQQATVAFLLEPSYATSPRADEVTTRLTGMVRVADGLRVGAGAEVRHREAGDDALTDVLVHGAADFWSGDFSVEAGVGVGVSPTFAPTLTAFVEPAVGLTNALWAHLRYWRLSFEDGGAHILAPAANLYLGPVNIEARYYLGLEDGGDVTHAGLLRARWELTPEVTLELGGGAGTAADYLTARDLPADGHWLGLVGVRWAPSWRHRIMAGYVHREERVGGETLARHEIALAWELRL
ncbi:MAG: YaiO family outer membrane beta-barrel protein [Deltaproteobacteria bacterium]|nr:YaiO family outer membrane beta-barrel protein [Deltaproteobacteria bacterium]